MRSRTNSLRSRARGASESSIDWFWHTMQRNSRDSSRARASFTGSAMISSGWTAQAADAPAKTIAATSPAKIRFKALLRRLQHRRRLGGFWRASPQPAVGQRQQAAESHQDRPEPDQQHKRLVIDPYRDRAIGAGLPQRDVELADAACQQ